MATLGSRESSNDAPEARRSSEKHDPGGSAALPQQVDRGSRAKQRTWSYRKNEIYSDHSQLTRIAERKKKTKALRSSLSRSISQASLCKAKRVSSKEYPRFEMKPYRSPHGFPNMERTE